MQTQPRPFNKSRPWSRAGLRAAAFSASGIRRSHPRWYRTLAAFMAEPPAPGPSDSTPAPPPPVDERRLAMACAAIVTVVVLAVFGRVLANGFVNIDDDVNIFANPHFHPPSWAGLSRLWHAPYFGLYIPVTYTVWGALVGLSLREGRIPALP